jgi:hypothetical protein
MSNDKVGGTGSTQGPHGSGTAAFSGAGHSRASTFAGSTFRLVPTPAALQRPTAFAAFEQQAPLRSLSAAAVQRQLVRENPRPVKTASAAASSNLQAPDAPVPAHGSEADNAATNDHDDDSLHARRRLRRDDSAQADNSMGRGKDDGVGLVPAMTAANEPKVALQRYRVIAQQRDHQLTQDQAFARSGLPGAELLTAAAERTAMRPPLRLALALGLRSSADLPLRSDGLPSPQSAQMGLVQSYLQIVPREEPPLSMQSVKQLLVETSVQLPPRRGEATTAGERRGDLLLLLPLMLFNAERLRTDGQRQDARDRLGLMRSSRAML